MLNNQETKEKDRIGVKIRESIWKERRIFSFMVKVVTSGLYNLLVIIHSMIMCTSFTISKPNIPTNQEVSYVM